MKKKEIEVRKKMVVIRVNDTEFEKVEKLRKRTTARSLSEYARNLLLAKPVIVKFRNRSTDDFLHEMLDLKRQLNGIGNNFNQAVHKLHLLDRIPEFRDWVRQYDGLQKLLVNKVEDIELKMGQLYQTLGENDKKKKVDDE